MAERKKQSLLNGAIILVISTLVVKVIGLCFKMPLGSMLGLVGYGYFTSVYAIYTPIYSISMAGLPIAVSRMVAEDVALNHYREARMTLKTARKIFLLVGTAGTLLMVIISIPYAAFISDIRNLPAMIAVAPSIFFCCYVSAYRGYYEGLRNMIPTAINGAAKEGINLIVFPELCITGYTCSDLFLQKSSCPTARAPITAPLPQARLPLQCSAKRSRLLMRLSA